MPGRRFVCQIQLAQIEHDHHDGDQQSANVPRVNLQQKIHSSDNANNVAVQCDTLITAAMAPQAWRYGRHKSHRSEVRYMPQPIYRKTDNRNSLARRGDLKPLHFHMSCQLGRRTAELADTTN